MTVIPSQTISEAAALFKLFADPTRLSILCVLQNGEQCVRELAQLTEQSESAVSHQLRQLRVGRLVAARKEGRTVFYRLLDGHISLLISNAIEHVGEPRVDNIS